MQETFGIALVKLDRSGVQPERLQQDLVGVALLADRRRPGQVILPSLLFWRQDGVNALALAGNRNRFGPRQLAVILGKPAQIGDDADRQDAIGLVADPHRRQPTPAADKIDQEPARQVALPVAEHRGEHTFHEVSHRGVPQGRVHGTRSRWSV